MYKGIKWIKRTAKAPPKNPIANIALFKFERYENNYFFNSTEKHIIHIFQI